MALNDASTTFVGLFQALSIPHRPSTPAPLPTTNLRRWGGGGGLRRPFAGCPVPYPCGPLVSTKKGGMCHASPHQRGRPHEPLPSGPNGPPTARMYLPGGPQVRFQPPVTAFAAALVHPFEPPSPSNACPPPPPGPCPLALHAGPCVECVTGPCGTRLPLSQNVRGGGEGGQLRGPGLCVPVNPSSSVTHRPPPRPSPSPRGEGVSAFPVISLHTRTQWRGTADPGVPAWRGLQVAYRCRAAAYLSVSRPQVVFVLPSL